MNQPEFSPKTAFPDDAESLRANLSLPTVEEQHRAALSAMETALGYHFRIPELLLKALIHPSMRDIAQVSYERLEFLGDAVLGLVVAEYLFQRFPDQDEGELTRIKSAVVSRAALARLGRQLGIAERLILGKGMLHQSSVLPRSVTANATEALLGALYLDGGLEVSRRFILHHLAAPIEQATRARRSRNYKSILQQLTQARGEGMPTYKVLSLTGPDHERTFVVCAIIGEHRFPPGSGTAKKIAEQRAARNALQEMEVDSDEQDPPLPP